MSISISGSNAISGLSGNDTDFDKVLEQLKSIESTQLRRLESWKSDWKLRYDAFSQIIEQVQAASSMLSQLADKNNFVSKIVQSSNDNCVTAVANASAQDVQHTITVKQTASNAIWANTGYVFESKADLLNDTGTDQYFKYSYAGKDYSFKVPDKTNLESFVSMINNSADNPGIRVSLIQTGDGYFFQVAGKDGGVDNDLQIYASNLKGMEATGTNSNWVTNKRVDPTEVLTNPNSYTFDIVLQNGAKKTLTLDGNETADDLASKLTNLAGSITATVVRDGSGNVTGLKVDGVKSITRRGSSEDAYTPASTTLTLNGGPATKLNSTGALVYGLNDTDMLTFKVTMDDGNIREVKVAANATNRDLAVALAQATQDSDNLSINGTGTGISFKLTGVSKIELVGDDGNPIQDTSGNDITLKTSTTPAKGVANKLGGYISAADLTVTFDAAKLGDRLDGKAAGEASDGQLQFMLVDSNGVAHTFQMDGDKTYQDLLDELKNQGGTPNASGDAITLSGVQQFKLSNGALGDKNVFSTSLKAGVTIPATTGAGDPAGDLFYTDAAGNTTLEKAPDLVYTVTTNDGKVGTLTLPSGSTMDQVLTAMQNTGGPDWVWKEADGTAVAAGSEPNLGVKFTDADGTEVTPPLGATAVYVNFTDVQSVTGVGIKGQVESTSNWSIQRAQNAIYKVDNWPIEMESTSNQVSDTIEGVIFTLHEPGEARISVSTDIPSVEQSIQNFLDAVNSVLLTVNDLMKYDETKDVTTNDPEYIDSDNYSQSGLTNQKGSLLTGNYGVQLFKSRFSSLLSTNPPGFRSQANATDILSGDVLATLSQMGIKTDTDTTSDTYGLLVRAPSSSIAELQSMDNENYNNMISNHLESVVDFFCASGKGSSTNTDFRYGSHVEGITTAGEYEVTYSVVNGEITNVMVGGEPATRDESMPGNYFSVASGDPRGLSILIDNMSEGDHPPAGESPMYVRIKQGLVQTVNNFFKAELTFNDVSISSNSTGEQLNDALYLKSQNGALMSLRDNYKSVMESIDVKIEREQRRIDTWYNRQKNIFANLETLLKQYSEKQTSLEAQLKQLSSGD